MISNKKEIKAFLPGTIIDVMVKEGQSVKAGETLAILEAMKMHNRMIAPVDGVIKSISAKVGNRVPKNFIVVELE